MSSKMTVAEREVFLADLHVGMIGIDVPGRAPVVVPVWYIYEPGGDILFMTEQGSRKEQLIKAAGRFTLCVQDEAPPYRFVSVEGPVVSTQVGDHDRDLLPIAVRYLGEEEGAQYVEDTRHETEILFHMRPERWATADYGKS